MFPRTPCRVVDTRRVNGEFGGPEMSAATQRSFALSNGSCGVPSNAAAVALNVTAVPNGQLGYLSIWPSGQSQPLVSTMNSDGRVKANAAIVPTGPNGGVNVYVSDPTHVVLDVSGYFVPTDSANALTYYPLTPCRVADTRFSTGLLAGPYLSANSDRDFPVLASSCKVPATAQAYALNLTVVPRAPLWYLTAWPSGQPAPEASTLNAPTGSATANAAIIPAGTNGGISAHASADTDLVIDINGYFAPASDGGLSLYTLTPCRVLDTRNQSAMITGTYVETVTNGSCNVPSAAQAYVLNTTVVPPGILGFLALWPNGQPQPIASTLNAAPGVTTSNMAILPSQNGSINIFASQPTQVILDVTSYFAP